MPNLTPEEMKFNELNFQNAKYSKTRLDPELITTDVQKFEKEFLTDKEKGGKARGLLFRSAVNHLDLNNIKGKNVLDYCCGRGDLGIYLAQKGANVYGFDVSEAAIKCAVSKAKTNNVCTQFEVMDAEYLRYPDNFFDYIIGFEALHHVILYDRMPEELKRVMRPGSKAIFAENWGADNFFFQTGRRFTSLYRAKSATRGEVILSKKLLMQRMNTFESTTIQPLSFLYLLKKYVHNKTALKSFRKIDSKLINNTSWIADYCGEAVIVFEK